MNKSHVLIFSLLMAAVLPLQAINPTYNLKVFSEQRGLQCLSARADFHNTTKEFFFRLNARQFLARCYSPFTHKGSAISVTLRPKPSRTFTGVTASLANVSRDSEDLDISFSVPLKDLANYQLVLQCYIRRDDMPSIGGERYVVDFPKLVGSDDALIDKELEELKKVSTPK